MNAIELHVHYRRGDMTPFGKYHGGFNAERAYDVELYDVPAAADARIAALKEAGIRVEVVGAP